MPIARRPSVGRRVLAAALEIADQGGAFRALSMPQARRGRWGSRRCPLYNHVANRDAIIDGLVEIGVARSRLPKNRAAD